MSSPKAANGVKSSMKPHHPKSTWVANVTPIFTSQTSGRGTTDDVFVDDEPHTPGPDCKGYPTADTKTSSSRT